MPWVRYITEHFPTDRNDATDAKTLWVDWRTSLLKRNAPGPGITVTHSQPHAHWHREPSGTLCLNLEDMWEDFVASVEHFIAAMRVSNPERRKAVLRRWQESTFDVRQLISTDAGLWAGASAVSASASSSITAIDPLSE